MQNLILTMWQLCKWELLAKKIIKTKIKPRTMIYIMYVWRNPVTTIMQVNLTMWQLLRQRTILIKLRKWSEVSEKRIKEKEEKVSCGRQGNFAADILAEELRGWSWNWLWSNTEILAPCMSKLGKTAISCQFRSFLIFLTFILLSLHHSSAKHSVSWQGQSWWRGRGKELWTVMGLLSTMQLFLGVTSAGGMTPSSRSTRWIETLVTEGIVPTKRKLPSFQPVLDSVFWAFCEASPGVWKLLDLMASKKLQTLGLKKGKSGGAAELSVITGQLKRHLSSAVMRANVIGLLDRRGKVGEGAGQANNRRQWIQAEEERLGWDRESQWLSRTTGRDLL